MAKRHGSGASRRRGGNTTAPPEARFQAALKLQQAGQYREAMRVYRKLLRDVPGHPQVLHFLGLCHYQTGEPEQALVLLERARTPLAEDAGFWSNLAQVQSALGAMAEAVASLERALELRPEFTEAWFKLGLSREKTGDPAGADAAYRRALQLQPDHIQSRHNLGLLMVGWGYHAQAEALYRSGLEISPEFPGFLEGITICLYHMGRVDEAQVFRERLERLAERQPLHLTLARIHRLCGEYEPARGHYAALLEQQPDAVGALIGWLLTGRMQPADRPRMEQAAGLLAQAGTSPAVRRELHFTLGKAYTDLGEHESAFLQYRQGNETDVGEPTYQPEAQSKRFAWPARVFGRELMERLRTAGNESVRPIFILGMPRSGTTLCEQILGSHPAVRAGGELPWIGTLSQRLFHDTGIQQQTDALAQADALALELPRLAEEYLRQLERIDPDRPHVIDKEPHNFMSIGLLQLLFPRATIIHCRRDPLDTCVSIYCQNLGPQHTYAHRLEDIAHYYREYRRLMGHWETVLPGRMYPLDYERLIADPEGQIRRLLAHCGLEWHADCLNFHELKRPVLTSSTWQVRQPLYHSSVRRWQHYERHIGPLLDGLRGFTEEQA